MKTKSHIATHIVSVGSIALVLGIYFGTVESQQCQYVEDQGVAYCTVEGVDKNIQDDSIAPDFRDKITLKKEGGKWQVMKVDHEFKCQKGRGHQDFSKENCI